MAEIHLLCNAHIDPVWQWEWEEGAAAAVSTFRAAASFCETFDDFVFCHNEALLYRWVEEYEPSLFERIQKLVKAGKWHIMGGWYLQPDCNMPSGESIIRQMQLGRTYFKVKFGVEPQTAVSFDAFGHNRGLVQLLKKAGYTSYLFMRPDAHWLELPDNDFIWVGYDGSEVMAHRIDTGYNSPLGHAKDKVENWLKAHPNAELGLIPWGVGNHGGGPSRKDIADLNALKAELSEKGIVHSTPEGYFAALEKRGTELPKVTRSLNPWAVGCYTSQIRIKQQHRLLEGLMAQAETMLTHASMLGLLKYPQEDMDEAARALCMSEFHDILPGSSVQPVEETSLQALSHGREIAQRMRARAFYALAADQKPAAPGTYPILVYNPYPYPVEQVVESEFMLADQNWKEEFTDFRVKSGEDFLPAQVEKERSNLPLDWRKRVVFRATLQPMQMNRFDCVPNVLPKKPIPSCKIENGAYFFENDRLHAEIDCGTGLMLSYKVDGVEYLADAAMKLLVLKDIPDSWGMTVDRYRDVIGEFKAMTPEQAARFANVDVETLSAVRVIEDGEVRTVIEAFFTYEKSSAVITYKLPKQGISVETDIRLVFTEKDCMVKLSVPTVLKNNCEGQAIFGRETLFTDGRENVAQQWVAAKAEDKTFALINDGVYGSDFADGELRAALMHSIGYTCHPIMERKVMPQDRYTPRMDQGERLYRFEILAGKNEEISPVLDAESQRFNEEPYALSFFPDGGSLEHTVGAQLEGKGVRMSAFRPTADGKGYIVRLFETEGTCKNAKVVLPILKAESIAAMKPFEVKTLRVDPQNGSVEEANVLE